MTTAITLAGPEANDQVIALMARYHEEMGLPYDDAQRSQVASPLLNGSPLGAIWLIGPQRAPLGYVMMTFGWSVPLGGMTGWLAEVYIRPSVRGRGIGTEVVHAVAVSLRDAGLQALHVHLPADPGRAGRFCKRAGFSRSDTITLMTDPL